jgi:hypothetical protein
MNMEFTLLRVGEETGIPAAKEDFMNLTDMIFNLARFGVNDQVVKASCNEVVKEIIECIVHEVLEHSWSVCKAKCRTKNS